MKNKKVIEITNPLDELCVEIKELVSQKEYKKCEKLLFKAMSKFPHDPQPHNWLGIVLEKMGNHLLAMKHFRAAWALDPTYRPANYNLTTYGTFASHGSCAFNDDDILKSSSF